MNLYLGLNSEEDFSFKERSLFTGVGMIRGENLCINKMQYFTKDDFCEYVTGYLNLIAKEFENNPVWYRTADLTAHQINLLDGCDHKINDEQYLIGIRGIRRNLKYLDTYYKEIEAFINAYRENNNLGILIPFVSNIDEVKQVQSILEEYNYTGKIGVMIEIASMIFMLDELKKLGIDYYTIGINDLTTSLLCCNRSLPEYSKSDEAVKKAVQFVINKVHNFDSQVTLAGYLNKDVVEYANRLGVDNINIHYNEIPYILGVQDEEKYVSHYRKIKARYKGIKNGKN